MKFRIEKLSNRYAIVIPADLMRSMKLVQGSEVEVTKVNKDDKSRKSSKSSYLLNLGFNQVHKDKYNVKYKVNDSIKEAKLALRVDDKHDLTSINNHIMSILDGLHKKSDVELIEVIKLNENSDF